MSLLETFLDLFIDFSCATINFFYNQQLCLNFQIEFSPLTFIFIYKNNVLKNYKF